MRRALIFLWLLPLAGAAPAQTIAAERDALARAKQDAEAATARADGFERAAARATDDAAHARRAEAAMAARIAAAEAQITAARAKIVLIEHLRRRQRDRLSRLQAPIVQLAAALQTLSQRPPALALVQPGTIDDLVHVRALLAAGVPEVQARAVGVREELAAAERLRGDAVAAAQTLVDARARLQADRTALVRLEAAHRARSLQLVDSAMSEQDRATAYGEQARDIVDLIDQLDDLASRRKRLAGLPAPMPRPIVAGLSTAAPPAPAGPPYRLPVSGSIVTGLGEVSEAGVRARGITLTTTPGAAVLAPAAGRIAYVSSFRGYGRIVIVEHGDGWTSLLTGLGRTIVAVGDQVARGARLGSAATTKPLVTIELRHAGHPVDILPLAAAG